MNTAATLPGEPGGTRDEPASRVLRWRTWLGAGGVAAALYLLTMAPGVLWGDSGDAQVRVLIGAWSDTRDLARAHVSFYALAIFAHRVLQVPAAIAANAVAALAGAVTVANTAVLLRLLIRGRTAWYAGVAVLMCSHTLWQMSCGAEVVTLSTALLSAELLCMVRYLQTGRRAWLIGAAIANGLGWTTHNLALLTWPAYGVLLLLNRRQLARQYWRVALGAAAAWGLGALPLIILTVQAFISTGALAQTLRSLFVGVYARQVFWHAVGAGTALRVGAYFLLNFPTPLLLLAPWGWLALRRSAGRNVWTYLSVAGITYLLFGARYHVADQYTFLVHAYLFVALGIAVGAERWLARFRGAPMRAAVVVLAVTGPMLYALAPALARRVHPRFLDSIRAIPHRDEYAWFLQPWRVGDHGAADFAREILHALPANAFLYADRTVREPLEYVQASEHLRTDIRLIGAQQRSASDRPGFTAQDAADAVTHGTLFTTEDKPAYLPDWLIAPQWGFERDGPVYRVVRRHVPAP
ncbi:MAG TPA: DUF2723 domain-containing protein [Phycisphaerae bacterium]|nr:DUF2723 domain-containing protein [Phycisphaerae bacterium]